MVLPTCPQAKLDEIGASQVIQDRLQAIRNFLPLVFGGLLFVLGVLALFHLLQHVNPAEVRASLRVMPVSILAAAFTATFVGYAALIAYDWFALRYIEKPVQPGIVALGGFLGYAFGNTIGVSVISGGAVRYRIYSAVGLNAFEVGTVSAYIAIALGTGLTLIGLAALALHPGAAAAYLPYSGNAVRFASGGIVIGSVAIILWSSLGQHHLKIRGFELRMPPPADLAGQLLATLIDVAAASFALWVLLPAGKPDFSTFVAIYAAATMIGVISHVPGGIGVFETVVLGSLPSSVPASEAAAALLLFRLIYYIVPFALGFLLVALNELRTVSGLGSRFFERASEPMQVALRTMHGMSPGLVATVVFCFGAYLLLVTMIPSVRLDAIAEQDLTAALLLEGGTLLTAAAGITLLILSHGLARRVSAAYWFTLLTLWVAAFAALLNDFDLENASVLALGALTLLPFRKAFDRHGHLTQGVFEPKWLTMMAGVAFVTATFFFYIHKSVPYSHDLWTEFSQASNTPRALRAGLAISAALFFFVLFLLTRPASLKSTPLQDAVSRERAASLVAKSNDPQAWLSQSGDKQFIFSDSGNSFIMYGMYRKSWIALGDPVGVEAEFRDLCHAFMEGARRANCTPFFYEVGSKHLTLWIELGLSLHKIGEEAVVKLPDFSVSGSRFKSMRAALHKREREGYTLEIIQPPHDDRLLARLHTISDAWLSGKAGREKGFSLGRFDKHYLDQFDIAVVRKEDHEICFANILSVSDGKYLTIDLMRYLPDEASGIMEYMFLRLLETYRDRGALEFNLGLAPLAGLSDNLYSGAWNRVGRMIYRNGGAFYNFEGLRAFKQKFHPNWRPRYLALPPNAFALVAMGDVALLTSAIPRNPHSK
ncbi:bifunctional lysylphosphatidylglycerol flippase/synthetase MprF [Labrenzia sp. CP4]|jgi:phosphatidylglycerol lysyltransferase|uniref:bifunctional lysylphosphatidylglycerol flippase/synthetase MprF n=1 Tax=Labrenzia sp. CP4 TaxID=1674922 RepID=UPI000783645D|nr:bifunctional lysylphosphatidylglycerol flippase/synthetase MprF [Labrenzia sp. CP4]